MKILCRTLYFIALVVLLHTSTSAAERVALVIGGDDYDHLPPEAQLAVAVSDARLISNALRALQPEFAVTLLENPTRLEAGKALDTFVDEAKDAECALVYFAGHGIEYNGENFLLNRDTKVSGISEDVNRMKRRLRTEAVSLQSLVDDLDATRAQVKVVILDACRDNPLQAETGSGTRSVVGSKGGLASVTPPSGTLISYAADAGQQANDGLFTAILTRNLTTPGKTIMEVFAATRSEVLKRSGEMAQNGKGVRHEPAEYVKLNTAGIRFSFLPGDPTVGNSDLAAKLKEMQARNAELEKALADRDTSAAEIERLRSKLAEASKEAADTMKEAVPSAVPATVLSRGFPADWEIVPGRHFTSAVETTFVWVEPGTFTMGSTAVEQEALTTPDAGGSSKQYRNEPAHLVSISKGYWVGTHEVTIGDYLRFLNESGRWDDSWVDLGDVDSCPIEKRVGKFGMRHGNGMTWRNENLPMVEVSWEGAVAYCNWINGEEFSRLPPGYRFGLPSEAEWEKAARAGTSEMTYGGDLTFKRVAYARELDSIAWYGGNSRLDASQVYEFGGRNGKPPEQGLAGTHQVGLKLPNALGAYDMIGNVWEWCRDWYAEGYYEDGQKNPMGAPTGRLRVFRGGAWNSVARSCRAAIRGRYSPGHCSGLLGFRVALSSAPTREGDIERR